MMLLCSIMFDSRTQSGAKGKAQAKSIMQPSLIKMLQQFMTRPLGSSSRQSYDSTVYQMSRSIGFVALPLTAGSLYFLSSHHYLSLTVIRGRMLSAQLIAICFANRMIAKLYPSLLKLWQQKAIEKRVMLEFTNWNTKFLLMRLSSKSSWYLWFSHFAIITARCRQIWSSTMIMTADMTEEPTESSVLVQVAVKTRLPTKHAITIETLTVAMGISPKNLLSLVLAVLMCLTCFECESMTISALNYGLTESSLSLDVMSQR